MAKKQSFRLYTYHESNKLLTLRRKAKTKKFSNPYLTFGAFHLSFERGIHVIKKIIASVPALCTFYALI